MTPPSRPAHSGRRSAPERMWTWVGLALVAALTVGLVVMVARPKPAEVIPSFADPIGALDTSKVPHGWGPDVAAAAKVAGLPAPVLAAQLETESNWQTDAISPADAKGLAQFTPDAWALFGRGDPLKPKDAIAAQGRMLRHLKSEIIAAKLPDNTTKLTLAAYNAGLTNVRKHRGVPPFPETQNYVKLIAQRMGQYARPLPHSSSPTAAAYGHPAAGAAAGVLALGAGRELVARNHRSSHHTCRTRGGKLRSERSGVER